MFHFVKRLFLLSVVTLVLLGAVQGSDSPSPSDVAVSPHKYSLFRWEVDHFLDKWVNKLQEILPWNSEPSREASIAQAQEFFGLIAEIRELERESADDNAARIEVLRLRRSDMQTDVEDGFDHLVAEGLAEADRACIFGYSYGGYAAMAAATLTPEKYQCVIAAAGVSDLLAFLRRERREEGSNSEAYQYWVAHIGHPGRDKETIKAVSPVEHAGNLLRPLLILHGKDDGVVDYEQAERMDKALRKAGKFFRLVTLENSSHSYMPEEDELTYYTEILAFLETHLPVN